MPAEQHLPRWTTMNIDDRRLLRCTAGCFEQLTMNLDSIRCFEHHFLRRHEVGYREIRGHALFRERRRLAASRRHHCRQRWMLCRRADVSDVLAVAGDERGPLES